MKIRNYCKNTKCTNIVLGDILYNWLSSELKYKDIELPLYKEIQYIRWHLTHGTTGLEDKEGFGEKYHDYLSRSHRFICDLMRDTVKTTLENI